MNKLTKIIIIPLVIIIAIVGIIIWKHLQPSINEEDSAKSISIVGGADGPTSVFIAGKVGDESGEKDMGYTQITMDLAKTIFETQGDYIILDVRRADEFAEGHIPGAINYANEDISDTDIAVLPDKNQTIYVYCRSGNRSKQASEKLVKLGYKNIIEFGGIIDWKGDIEK